jgi:Flp pilus assembly protein TadG
MSQLHVQEMRARAPRRQRGLALVEFVVTAPFVFLLLLGSAEIGRAFIQYATLTYAVRDATRFVSSNSINGTTGVVDLSATTITQAKNLVVYGSVGGSGPARLPSLQPSQVAVTDVGGSNIRVTTIYPYQPMLGPVLPGFTGTPINLGFDMVVAVTMRAIS